MTQNQPTDLLQIVARRIELQNRITAIDARLAACETYGKFGKKRLNEIDPQIAINTFDKMIKQWLFTGGQPADEWYLILFALKAKQGLIAKCARIDEFLYFANLAKKLGGLQNER